MKVITLIMKTKGRRKKRKKCEVGDIQVENLFTRQEAVGSILTRDR